ncbi:DUF484 domain-containing protein [Paramagnetospirillum kuznetsovii]|uniref:DUF484 domain-containing protein n=1 Tax=Paramagnetospirillum kuznetsovii TaxID=2053833 RepID=A0A364P1V7_9PROT|nr:DUF484 family protein [Paramagnetospirillum kuznetsovii]RAU23147.1 DUF484 domain-containing protein [Paramagnetospirillum kuznetsovii]
MARKRDDAVLQLPLPDEKQVEAFLRAHSDFLVRHPDLLLNLSPPSRWSEDDGVLDMQVFMIDRLRDEVERVRGAAEHLIHTSRSNMSIQTRTHKAVLAILSADDMAELVEAVRDDLPTLLDVDVATLCFETPEAPLPKLAAPGVLTLPNGTVAKMMGGADRDCALTEEMPGDPALFGDGAGLVLSSAVVRLSPGAPCPDGVMALGSRHGRTFHAGQATELITFLARVVERCVLRFAG